MRQFFRNIARTFAWLPVIWRDREFDYAFLFRIITFKLERMAKQAETGWITEGALQAARRMRAAATALSCVAEERILDSSGRELSGEEMDKAKRALLKRAMDGIAEHGLTWWD